MNVTRGGVELKMKLKKKGLVFIRGWIASIFIAILIATSFKSAVADWYVVPTGSMKPTIVEGDRILTNKLAYDLKIPYTTWRIATWDSPKRGDIVVFYSPVDGKRLVKRVIGLPGDLISMRNNRLDINGVALEYESIQKETPSDTASEEELGHQFYQEYLFGIVHRVMTTPTQSSLRSFRGVIVPKGHYFMMGDNRDNSADSRFFGFVDRKQILGRANSIVISLDPDHYYRPRWDRFLSDLL
jgi:signal peptidase I